jgi:hypothetical protein
LSLISKLVLNSSNYVVNNTKKKIFSQNTCCIYFLYHFDLGSDFLINGISKDRFEEIKNDLENSIRKEELKITRKETVIMDTPMQLRDVHPEGYPIYKDYLKMDIVLSNQPIKFNTESKCPMELKMAKIYMFDTGIATVTLQFELNFKNEGLNKSEVYHAYKKIYSKVIDLLKQEAASTETDSEIGLNEVSDWKPDWKHIYEDLEHIYEIIKKIRGNFKEKTKSTEGQEWSLLPYTLFAEGQEWTLSPYTLFCLPKIDKTKIKEFFPLLHLREEINDLSATIENNEQLKETDDQYNMESDDNHFITDVEAALLIDKYEQNMEIYVRILELCSYIYLSTLLFQKYLSTELDQLSKSFDSFNKTIDKPGMLDQRILHIDKLRIRAIYIQQLKYQFYILMWEDTDKIFEKILEDAWETEKELYTKIRDATDLLNSGYQSLQDRRQNKSDKKINNGLSLLQMLAIPLTLVFTLLTIADDSSICNLFQERWNYICEDNTLFVKLLLITLVFSIPSVIIAYYKYLRLT